MSTRPLRTRGSAAQADKIPQLSCESCHERKVRCDKKNPCSTCQSTGIVCVPLQRKRFPRGRHVVKENKELRERLTRLESLVGDRAATDQSPSASISAPQAHISSPSDGPSGTTSYSPSVTSVHSNHLLNNLSSNTSSILNPPAASLTRTKRSASTPPRHVSNGFWNDLIDEVPT